MLEGCTCISAVHTDSMKSMEGIMKIHTQLHNTISILQRFLPITDIKSWPQMSHGFGPATLITTDTDKSPL